MADYSSNLKPWGDSGEEFPDGYQYKKGEQPVDAWDNFVNWNLINDATYLINQTNKRLESDGGTSYPESPEPGNLSWRSDSSRLSIFDEINASWRELAYREDVDFSSDDLAAHVATFDSHTEHDSVHHSRYTDPEARSAVEGSVDAANLLGNSGSDGEVLTSTGSNTEWSQLPSGGFQTVETFTSDGTFTVPHNVDLVFVEVIGGGGGGGGALTNTGASDGGGAGGYGAKMCDVTPGENIPVTIGDRGDRGEGSSDGEDGGTSSFGSYVSATGGGGGRSASNGGSQGLGGRGGVGSSDADIRVRGDAGEAGVMFRYGRWVSGVGGRSVFGGTSQCRSHSNNGGAATGRSADSRSWGGGGSGCGSDHFSSTRNGGYGRSGIVIVRY